MLIAIGVNENGVEQCVSPLIGRLRVRLGVRLGVAGASSLFSPFSSLLFSAAGQRFRIMLTRFGSGHWATELFSGRHKAFSGRLLPHLPYSPFLSSTDRSVLESAPGPKSGR